jgi:menaquinone-dependent protoporphyrinogen oxidase
MNILVAYATKYGSTKEVAEAIAKTLKNTPAIVDLQPLNKVKSLNGVDAIVMGAPLYMFRWHSDAKNFLSRFAEPLKKIPTAAFALGPFHDEEKEWQDVRGVLDKELAQYPSFSPIAVKIFGGKFDPASLTFPFSLIPALKQMPASDIRDWQDINAWAEETYKLFTAASIQE